MGWLNPVLPRGVRSCYPQPSQGLELWGLPMVGVTGYGLTAQTHPTPSWSNLRQKRAEGMRPGRGKVTSCRGCFMYLLLQLHLVPSLGSITGTSVQRGKKGNKETGWKNLNLLRGAASAESVWINQSTSSWQEQSAARRCQRKGGKDASQSASTVLSTSSTPLTGLAEGNQ